LPEVVFSATFGRKPAWPVFVTGSLQLKQVVRQMAGAAVVLLTTLAAPAAVDVSKLPPAAARPVDFSKDIQPLLAKHCFACHGPEKQKADLRWDDKASAFRAGDHGPHLVPGKSAESRVIHLVAGLEPDSIMPPKGEPLSADEVGLLRAWIDQGANWPEIGDSPEARKRNHWAFKTPVRPAVPEVKNKKWPRNPIDNFILAQLEM
jgi:mono/diheme cytochrome c family protein